MNIDSYILNLEFAINSFSLVASYNLNIDRKSEDIAFLSGRINFRDNSILYFKEFIESAGGQVKKFKYSYNYRQRDKDIFRYDNAPDPRARDLKTFPNHKHLDSGEIVESKKVDLPNVLGEIEKIQFKV